MINYTCEETSVCIDFPSVICFHCNHRLCLLHFTEHNKKIFGNITHLSKEIDETFLQINEESEKRRNIFNNILTSFNQWRTQQIEKIEQIYENHLKCFESQQEILTNTEMKLFERLERDARQPLEYAQRQPYAATEIINHIQQTIKKVREDNVYLKWQLATLSPPPVDIEYSPVNIPSISISLESDNNTLISKQSMIKKETSSSNIISPQSGCTLKQLVQLFANISSIEEAKSDIFVYLENQNDQFRLPIVICSYLTAWYRKSNMNEKVFLLNEHITTIQKYLTNRQSDFDVLIGIQIFFYHQNIKEDKSEMMTFLLQYFLNHQCIDQYQIFNWYNNSNVHDYEGFDHAKELATPFIKSLSTIKSFDQIKIKQEPVVY